MTRCVSPIIMEMNSASSSCSLAYSSKAIGWEAHTGSTSGHCLRQVAYARRCM